MTLRDLGDCIAAFCLVFAPLYLGAILETIRFLATEMIR